MMKEEDPDSLVNGGISSEVGASSGTEAVDDVSLSLAGINMMLNNGFKESNELFNKYRHYSPLMSAGASFVSFMHAMMTFEDDKMEQATTYLKETVKLCETDEGFIKSLKKKLSKRGSIGEAQLSVEDRITRQVVTADSYLYLAAIIFTKQEISSFIRGGWLLRKAWKIYERIYRDLLLKPHSSEVTGPNPPEPTPPPSEVGEDEAVGERPSYTLPLPEEYKELSLETLSRLRGAVCFGYGLFQLAISMMPPNLLKLVNLLGFVGDRQTGLKCLEEANRSKDMKAPLATLSLLWYHCVVRAFFALDGASTQAGLEEATQLLEEKEKEYPTSALFLFFKGRILKQQGELDQSLSVFGAALDAAEDQREVQLICVYEIGWANLMKLNWEEALMSFMRLKDESKWSVCYYTYLLAVCQGALGQLETAQELFKEAAKLAKRKTNQLENYVLRRSNKLKSRLPNQQHVVLLAIEMLYLWRTLPMCPPQYLQKMLRECDVSLSPELNGLKSLLKGAIHRTLGSVEVASQCLEDAMAFSQGKTQEAHVAPFACYELGTLLAEKEFTLNRGKVLLLQAKENYKDYDFENRLGFRIHAALQRIKEASK